MVFFGYALVILNVMGLGGLLGYWLIPEWWAFFGAWFLTVFLSAALAADLKARSDRKSR